MTDRMSKRVGHMHQDHGQTFSPTVRSSGGPPTREARRGIATAAIVLMKLLRILDVTLQPSGIAAAGAAGGLAIMGLGWVAEVSLRRIGPGRRAGA